MKWTSFLPVFIYSPRTNPSKKPGSKVSESFEWQAKVANSPREGITPPSSVAKAIRWHRVYFREGPPQLAVLPGYTPSNRQSR